MNVTNNALTLRFFFTIIAVMFTYVQAAFAEEIPLETSPPAVIYYTTNGTVETVPSDVNQNESTDRFTRTTSDLAPRDGSKFLPEKAIDSRLRTEELKRYLRKKHKKIDDATYDYRNIRNDPSLSVHISGDIRLEKIPDIEDRNERVRAVARAFMEEEAELLGITDISEFREYHFEHEIGAIGGTTDIRFQRYIHDVEVEHAQIRMSLKDDGTIWSISAYAKPAPPEMYAAAVKETISVEQAKHIIEEDYKAARIRDIDKMLALVKPKKVLIPVPPYVVWKASGIWAYTINAFTGEIIERRDNWKTSR